MAYRVQKIARDGKVYGGAYSEVSFIGIVEKDGLGIWGYAIKPGAAKVTGFATRKDAVAGLLKEREEIGGRMVTRKNLMTGEEYQERADTPVYLSPAYETYWCM